MTSHAERRAPGRTLTRLCPLMTRAYSPATASRTEGSLADERFSGQVKPFPTAWGESSIFSRAFLGEGKGTRGLQHRSRACKSRTPSASACVYLSSSRTSRTVWPVTMNTSAMSSVNILQE